MENALAWDSNSEENVNMFLARKYNPLTARWESPGLAPVPVEMMYDFFEKPKTDGVDVLAFLIKLEKRKNSFSIPVSS